MSTNVIRQDVIELVTKTNMDELDKLRKELDELKSSINGNAKKPLDELGNTTAFTKLKKGFSDVSKSVKNFGNQIDSAASAITSKLFNLKNLIVGAIGGTVVKSAIDVVVDRQDITSQFEVLLGSAEKAQQRVQELTDFAGQTPFTRDEIFAASKQLQVFTGNALSTGNSLKVIGDVAAGTGQSFEDVALWTGRLYDAMKSGNKVGEMTSRLQEMGAISGEDRTKIEALAEAGGDMGTKWAQIEKIFGRFDGTMEKLSNNMGNMLTSLKSFATNNFLLPLGEGIASGLQPAIQKFRQFRKTNKADVEAMGETLKKFGENICIPLFNGIEAGAEGLIKIIGALKDGVDGLEKLKGQNAFMDGIIGAIQFVIEHKDTVIDALQGIALVASSIVVISKIKQLVTALKWFATPLGMISSLAFVAFMVFKKNGGTVQDIINGISKAIGWLKDNIKWLLPVVGALAAAFLAFKGFNFFKGLGKSKTVTGNSGGLSGGMMNFFKEFASLKMSTVLKGMANIAIVVGGLTLISSIFLPILFELAKTSSLRAIAQSSLILMSLGTVGSALSWLASKVGNIPISKVSKGLANISIALVGIGSLVWLATKVFKEGIDLKEMLEVSALIGILGAIGSALSWLASKAGNIPVRKVSKGLTNISISLSVIGALTWTATEVFKNGIDLKEMLEVSALVGVLGVLGAALSGFAGIAGGIPIRLVVKGLTNISMSLSVIGALAWTATRVFKEGINLTEMLKISALISILGVIGSGLSVLAGIVGLIPFLLVIKGLANIALVLGGLGALVLAATKVFKDGVNFNEMYELIKLITVLGIAGAALSVLAGIVGVVPFPIVISGLASIATVIGGLSGIIYAFGRLSEIPGFNDFISKGGDALANLFSQIGKIAGAVVGSFGESLSSSLPKIGENLGKFGEKLKPLIAAFDGVNVSSMGTFFSELGSFFLKMTANDLLSKLTGGTDLITIGENLSAFAEKSKTFFETIAALPEGAITRASELFNALIMIKELPESGGFTQIFTGDALNSLNLMAEMLPRLGESVQGFYESIGDRADFNAISSLFNAFALVKELPDSGGFQQFFTGDTLTSLQTMTTSLPELGSAIQTFYESIGDRVDFTALSELFNALASIKELPNKGGFLQFFTGDPLESLKSMGDALPGLGEGVKSFFESVNGIDDFSKINALFNALASIKELPKDNGFWTKVGDAVTGQETKSQLAVVGDDLKSFGENAKEFFNQVNSLNITNLYGLWESLKGAKDVSADVFKAVSDDMDKIVKKVSELPQNMADGIKSGGNALKESLVSIWVEAAKAMAQPVNKVIEGANWILKEFGSDKRVASWTPYAKGTNGHKGGNALVNDGRGAELVQMPNGRTFIPQGRNVFIPNAPKGMKVLPAEQTANILGRKNPTFHYANGTGDIDIWSYIDDAKGLISQMDKKFVNYDGLSGFPLNASKSMVSMIEGQMSGWVKKMFDEMGAKSLASYAASAGVEQWRSTVALALRMTGQYSEDNVKRTLYQMQTESNGNPRAINLWDSNAKKGTPSKGLMQVIDPTFKSYAMPGFSSNIYDPLSNILASIRYAVSRYGSLAKAYRGTGYANGGIANKPSIFGEDGEEMAIPLSKDKRKRGLGLWAQAGKMLGVKLPSYTPESAGYGSGQTISETNNFNPSFSITINGAEDTRSMERKIKQFVSEALEETFESMARKTPVRQY